METLSWKQVAKALQEEFASVQHENVKLKRQKQAMLNLIVTMSKWIASGQDISRGPGAILHSASNLSLHRVTLLVSNPDSRRHGLDWLTQILYQNTDAFLERYAMPSQPSNSVYGDFLVDVSDLNNVQHVFQAQVEIPLDMDHVVDPVRLHLVNNLNAVDTYIVHRVSPLMTYIRRYAENEIGEQYAMNVLYREIPEPDRVTFVGQTVEDDKFERFSYSRRKSITWVVVARVTPSSTRVTLLSLSSLEYTDSGFLSLQAQAKNHGIELDPNDPRKAEQYAARCQIVGAAGVSQYTTYLSNVVKASIEQGNAPRDPLSMYLDEQVLE
ncbi:hypothetical protein LEN26_020009 [Aphanomyces euteiches]|nr:hypothetical protein LEN26_020009 [Aphanomyces euteiches]KAH9102326.1 hypothetical protein AeMF1_021106 [Aphanomyces euteiches]KAH9189604.1 hypothetical protein AeNC1_008415 [Aphanomyces euteiches]